MSAELEAKRQEKLLRAKAIVDGAKSENRGLTDSERAEIDVCWKEAEELLSKRKAAEADAKMFDDIGAALKSDHDSGAGDDKPRPRTIGEAFTKSDAYKMAATYAKTGGRFSTQAVDTGLSLPSLQVAQKALTIGSPGLDELNLGGYQELPLLPLLLNRPTIAALFGSGALTGSILTYLRETAATSGAAAVAESGVKPASTLTLDRVSHSISKVATVLDVPDEVLEDLAQARSYIDGRLTLFIQMEEEDQLLNGSGVAPNITGLNTVSGTQSVTVAATGTDANAMVVPNLDGIYNAITEIRVVALMEPDGIVVHPNDYQKFRLGRDANDQYFGGGPFMGQYGQGGMVNDAPIWGLRTVVTAAVTEGTAWVGAFEAGGTVWRKGGITVDATNSDGDKFLSNITTIRAEERVGLAVYRPAAFDKVTFDWVSAS